MLGDLGLFPDALRPWVANQEFTGKGAHPPGKFPDDETEVLLGCGAHTAQTPHQRSMRPQTAASTRRGLPERKAEFLPEPGRSLGF